MAASFAATLVLMGVVIALQKILPDGTLSGYTPPSLPLAGDAEAAGRLAAVAASPSRVTTTLLLYRRCRLAPFTYPSLPLRDMTGHPPRQALRTAGTPR